MALDPAISARVAHLWDAHVLQLLSGEVEGVPPAGPVVVEGVAREDGSIPGPGGDIPVRWYRSTELAADALAPTLVWAHGGGWQFGDLDMPEADSVAQRVAAALPGVVVSVDYRLAPAHQHPAALEDVLAVQRWVVDHGAEHGIDPRRVALGGASAGGHLAATAALALAGEAEAPAALWLAYPVTDPDGGPYDGRHPDCPPVLWLDHLGTTKLFEGYLGDDPAGADPRIIPARGDLSVLPPTLVTTAECDSLCPQARHFVGLADAAGAAVEHHHVQGVLHGYLNIVGEEAIADAALDRHVAWLRDVLIGS
ncbi:alpha/beta hydrolase [Acidimicrobiia bacterium EGI L10123]|uniref:alpha/beta hydrolase n=1 Tax=Salinilacustrithrix flava TaxID=2957203 RepID=UPI003D7C2772|nr:alpha/beta hydrolase [Acidimicrobiia bacterium EGI L10123]